MSVKLYPNLTEEKEEKGEPDHLVKTFRLTTIRQMQTEIEQDLAKYSRTKRKYSSLFNAVYYANAGTVFVSSCSSTCAVGLLASGIGFPAAVPLGVVSACFGLFSFASSTVNKKLKTKLQKHTAIVQLITNTLSSFYLITSKALSDSFISDNEFKHLHAEFNAYKQQKFELQKKSQLPLLDTEAVKKQCLTELNKTLDLVLKK